MITVKIKLFLVALMVFFITDFLWIGFFAKNLYLQNYKPWVNLVDGQLKPVLWPALMVYLLLALGVVVFVLPAANYTWLHALYCGAIFGAIVYGVYDFTLLALFKGFPTFIALLDWVWGMVLCSWSSVVTLVVYRYLK